MTLDEFLERAQVPDEYKTRSWSRRDIERLVEEDTEEAEGKLHHLYCFIKASIDPSKEVEKMQKDVADSHKKDLERLWEMSTYFEICDQPDSRVVAEVFRRALRDGCGDSSLEDMYRVVSHELGLDEEDEEFEY